MNFFFWLSLIVFIATAGISVELAFGWRKIRHLKDVSPAYPRSSACTSDAPDRTTAPRVSVIVSALNEADTIEPALHSLLSIDYPDLEVIAINDRSTDATPAILDRVASTYPSLRVLHLRELPPGWLGKNHALHQGALRASSDYLLFTDADAVFAPTTIRRAVTYCEQAGVDHLTLFFDVVARTQLLRMMVLSFAAAFMVRFKPWKVGDSPTHFVGVGGFNMVRRSAYLDIGGHAAIPLAVLDDMNLGKLLKQKGFRQHVLFGTDMVLIEWYRSTPQMVRGMEKNIFSAFDYQLGQLVAATMLMAAFRIWPWLALLVTGGATWWLNLATCLCSLALYMDLLHARGWRYRCLVFAPLVPFIDIIIWWRGSLLVLLRGEIEWRGTRYALRDLKSAHNSRSP